MGNRVLALVGASGFLGQEYATRSRHKFGKVVQIAASKGDYSIDELSEIKRLLDKNGVTHIVNFVALTNVEVAEQNPLLAMKLNVDMPRILQEWASEKSAFLIHISSDQLYDAANSRESDVSIKNVYAATKFLGEKFTDTRRSAVLRTNFVGRAFTRSNWGLADWIVNSARQNTKIHLFQDVFFNPLHISTLIEVIDYFLNTENVGLFNVGSVGIISKADFAISLISSLVPEFDNYSFVSQDAVENRTVRPNNMSMNCGHFQTVCDFTLPTIDQSIKLTIMDYENE